MIVRIQVRRGTSTQWTNSNPVLHSGEFGYETNTGKLKIGNGTDAWDDLSYLQGSGGGGSDGLSAYEIAVQNGFEGTEQDWLISLRGADGLDGTDGINGKSAYDIAVDNGFVGTEQEWLESLSPVRYMDGDIFEGDGETEETKTTIKDGSIGEEKLSEGVRSQLGGMTEEALNAKIASDTSDPNDQKIAKITHVKELVSTVEGANQTEAINRITPTDFVNPPEEDFVLNDLTSFSDNSNYPTRWTWIITDPNHGRALYDGWVKDFRVKLTNSEVGRTVIFYVLREETSGNFTVKYSSGPVSAESDGINIFTPEYATVPILENDVVGIYANPINTANSLRFLDSGGPSVSQTIFVNTSLSLDQIITGTPDQNKRRYSFGATIIPKSIIVSQEWGNKPNGFVKLNEEGYVPNSINREADSYWDKKKIIWVGTSIPAGGNPSYPSVVGNMLNAEMVNESVGSSGIIWDGTRSLSLSATQSELTASYGGGFAVQSYENKLIGKSADLIVLDHGHNDREKAFNPSFSGNLPWTTRTGTITATTGSNEVAGSGTTFTSLAVGDKIYNNNSQLIGVISSIESNTSLTLVSNSLINITSGAFLVTSMDRTKFLGAFNYVIDKCYEDNPLVSFAVIVPPNRYTVNGQVTTHINKVRELLIQLADAYGFPYCDLMNRAGFNPTTLYELTNDGTHPDTYGNKRIAQVLYSFIKGIA